MFYSDIWLQEAYKTGLNEKYGSEIESQPSFDATIWVEATGGVSKNKVYGFGPHAHSSNVLVRTSTSCSTSQLGSSSGSAPTTNSVIQGAMENTQEHIMAVLMNPQHKEMLRSLISSLGFTSSEPSSPPPQEGTESANPSTGSPCD